MVQKCSSHSTMLSLIFLSAIILITNTEGAEQLCDSADRKCSCYFDKYMSYVVDCKRMDFNKLPDRSQFPDDYEVLDISHNFLKSLGKDDTPTNTLEVILASHNEIESITSEFIQKVKGLRWLDLRFNKITRLDNELFNFVPKVTHLDLSHNKLDMLQDGIFNLISGLTYLDLSYNNLGGQLQAYDKLIESPLGLNNNLTHLYLDSVNFTLNLPNKFFSGFDLLHLTIADNDLQEIPIASTELRHLDLSGNQFTNLTVHSLNYPKLKSLKINRLELLEYIGNYAFYNMAELEDLSMEHCRKLKELNPLAFGVLNPNEKWNLKSFSIAGNGLRSINATYFDLFILLEKVNLGNNPFDCDCNILWFNTVQRVLIHKETIRCATPYTVKNKMILQLSKMDLPKCVASTAWRTHKILVSIISILIIFLAGIIIYLMYLGPFVTISTRYVGANSPYSHNIIINNDD